MDSAKAALRRVMKARIAALDAAYDKAAGEGIVRRLTAHPAWAAADSVFCYVGRRGDRHAALLRAALEAGKTLAVPLCMGPGVMQARAVRSLEELAPAGPYGIPEPPAGAPEVLRSDWRCACCPALPPRRMERAWAMAAGITTAFCRWHATQ
ncbi:MAG: 5-formyltetrahydrofolate cyclo-ligase [Ruthenibacterium lactatiformans]